MQNTNIIKIDFLSIERKRKARKALHSFLLISMIMNMSMAGVLTTTSPALACHGDIIVEKATPGVDTDEEFSFEVKKRFGTSIDIQVESGEAVSTDYSGTGVYYVIEEEKPGWVLESIVCDDTCYNSYTVDLAKRKAIITITGGDPNIKCTFTNRKEKVCGDGIVQTPNDNDMIEECDDGANGDDTDGCTDECTYGLEKNDINTCVGNGDVYTYQDEPFQSINTSFTVNHDELLIFTRADYVNSLNIEINNSSASLDVVADHTTPFPVKVYKTTTSPGDSIRVSGSAQYGARAIQAYVSQDSTNPAIDPDTLEIIYDDQAENDMYLTAGDYEYIIFDKYSKQNNGSNDSRSLSVSVTNTSGYNQTKNYTKPAPTGIEGIVLDSYTITDSGMYNFAINTQDSVYWPKFSCEEPTYCGDGIKQSPNGEGVDEQCDGTDGVSADEKCNDQCQIEQKNNCGDGIVQTPNDYGFNEQCDGTAGVGVHQTCNADCTISDLTYCGDGIKQSPNGEGVDEQCDGTDGVSADEKCNAQCQIEQKNYCGDGIIQTPNDYGMNEQCDGLAGIGIHEECNAQCQIDPVTYCGDGIKQSPNGEGLNEECDGTDGVTGDEYCTADCEIEITTYCGDGVVQTPNDDDFIEECDGTAGVGEHQVCNEDCTIDDLTYCGDGIKQYPNDENVYEECDGTDGVDAGETCDATCHKIYDPIKIKAQKVVCDDESYLPDWSLPATIAGEPNKIDANTASVYVANSDGHCYIHEGWSFEYGFDGEAVKQAGDHIGSAPQDANWHAFTGTAHGGLTAVAEIDGDTTGKIWVREVLPEGYIPFTDAYDDSNTVSAEMFCHTDIANYDNYEYIDNMQAGEKYYCVAFNVEIPVPSTLIVKKEVEDGDRLPSDWTIHVTRVDTGALVDSFPGSANGVSIQVEEGEYQVTETGTYDNYILKSYNIDCDSEGKVYVGEGETKTCKLINKYEEPPVQTGALIVKKIVVGGSATSSDWLMHISDKTPFAGSETGVRTSGLALGMYQVYETGGPDYYELTYSGDCGDEGHVTVVAGEDNAATCILTNTFVPPTSSIEVCKYIDTDGSAETTDDRELATTSTWSFKLTKGDVEVIQDTVEGCTIFDNLVADSYILSELDKAGWAVMVPSSGIYNIELGERQNFTYDFVNYELPEPICGDGVVNREEEQCDDGPDGSATCTANCTVIETPDPYCGDGIVNRSEEECDDGPTGSATCTAQCTTIDTPECGDGVCNGNETCGTCSQDCGSCGGGGWLIPTNRVIEEVIVLPEIGEPQLVINKNVSQKFANAGDTNIGYKIVITNNGNLTAFNAILTDNLPAGLVYSGGNTDSKVWQLGDIEPGKIIVIEYDVDVKSEADEGVYTNIASVIADNHPEIDDDAELEVRIITVKGITLVETGFSVEELVALILLTLGLMYITLQLKERYADLKA